MRPHANIVAQMLAAAPDWVSRSHQIQCGVSYRIIGQLVQLLEHPKEGIPQLRRGVAALLGELPDGTIPNRFAATSQLSLSYLEVVVREQGRAFVGAHRPDCVRFVPEQGGGVGRPLTNVGQFDCACRGEQPVVSSEDCVGRTVEQISTQCDGHREQQWMAAAEQVDGAIWRDGRPRGEKYAE